MRKEERIAAMGKNETDIVPQTKTNPVRSVINSAGAIKDISGILKTAKEFENSAVGKIILREVLGYTSPSEKPTKTAKVEVLLKNLRNFLIPLIITITGCAIAFKAFEVFLGV